MTEVIVKYELGNVDDRERLKKLHEEMLNPLLTCILTVAQGQDLDNVPPPLLKYFSNGYAEYDGTYGLKQLIRKYRNLLVRIVPFSLAETYLPAKDDISVHIGEGKDRQSFHLYVREGKHGISFSMGGG